MIEGGESLPGCGLLWARGLLGCWLPGVGARVRRSGLTSTHSASCGGRGHDHVIRGPGCSVSSASAGQGPAQDVRRAHPGPCDPLRGCHRAAVWGAAGCGAISCPASASRCQARVASLRAMAVVAIFFPRRCAMRWTVAANCGERLAVCAAPHPAQPHRALPGDVPVAGGPGRCRAPSGSARPRTPAGAPRRTG